MWMATPTRSPGISASGTPSRSCMGSMNARPDLPSILPEVTKWKNNGTFRCDERRNSA